MKVRFNVDSGANIHSNNESEWFDPVEDLGFEEGEWQKFSDDEKWEQANIWAQDYLEINYEETD